MHDNKAATTTQPTGTAWAAQRHTFRPGQPSLPSAACNSLASYLVKPATEQAPAQILASCPSPNSCHAYPVA